MDFKAVILLDNEKAIMKKFRKTPVIDENPNNIASLKRIGFIMDYAYGETGRYKLTDDGQRFLNWKTETNREFWKNVITKFISGFISGLATGVLLSWLVGIPQL